MESNILPYWLSCLVSFIALMVSIYFQLPFFIKAGFFIITIIFFGLASYLTSGLDKPDDLIKIIGNYNGNN